MSFSRTGFKNRLFSLLERWAERENIRMNGRALIIPEVTHRWGFNRIGGLEIISSGVCWERMTGKRDNSDLDDFGVAFRQLKELEQALILVDHFGSDDEWREAIEFFGILKQKSFANAKKKANQKLRRAWTNLAWKCLRRGLIGSSLRKDTKA